MQAQVANFEILKYGKGKAIGHIQAEKSNQNSQTTYNVTSKASFRVVLKYVRETILEVVYEGENLISSDAKQIMNQDLKQHRVTTRQGAKYNCIENRGKEEFSIDKDIRLCSSVLYFKEPKGYNFVFAENYQELCPIVLIEPGIYEMTLPNGKINHYVYKAGVLQEIRVFRSIVDLVFRRMT